MSWVFAAGLGLAFFDHAVSPVGRAGTRAVFDGRGVTHRRPPTPSPGTGPNRTRLAGPRFGAFWKPGDPALISLPGPASRGNSPPRRKHRAQHCLEVVLSHRGSIRPRVS